MFSVFPVWNLPFLTECLLEFFSGVIGFLLCAKEGPPVNFLTPINPIEEVEGATKAGREIRFYNSEVSFPLINRI